MSKTDLDGVDAVLPDLRRLTQARVLIGRFGAGQPTRVIQAFLMDQARARQAVWSEVDWRVLRDELADLRLPVVAVNSLAPDRGTYVRRPDLGRKLEPDSASRLADGRQGFDVAIVVGDGLSASAIAINAAPMIRALVQRLERRQLTLSPIVLAAQARVALGDPIGELLRARVIIMLIGERPGLSAADSLGVYVTYHPAIGTPDSRRNCVSNIRDGGLSIEAAASAVDTLVADILRMGVSGVALQRSAARSLGGGTLGPAMVSAEGLEPSTP